MTLSRRQMIKVAGLAGAGLFLGGQRVRAQGIPDLQRWQTIHDRLAAFMVKLAADAKRQVAPNCVLLTPQTGTGYNGVWPDDCLYPLMALPSLSDRKELAGVIGFLSDSVLGLPVVPDRVEPDGLPIMSPGPSQPGKAMAPRMPLHLPAAWVRLLDYYQSFGVEIPQKKAWAALIARSFAAVPFANGLAYNDPQSPTVGFGFHDSIRITGMELMSSLMLYRGFQRAEKLFAGDIDEGTLALWRNRADGIRSNLHRLYDPAVGGYIGGSKLGRQFSVWANGLAYFLASPEQQKSIARLYADQSPAIFLKGCTRQIAEEGWQGNGAGTSYQNGGFWATGTGYVLPLLARENPELALRLADELVENLPRFEFAEYLKGDGSPGGPKGFLASVALPLIGVRSIIANQPLLELF